MTILLIITVGIAALFPFLLLIFKKKKADIFNPIYFSSIYFFLLFVLRPLYDITLGSSILGFPPLSSETEKIFQIALIYVFFSYIAFYFGYYSGISKKIIKIFPKLPNTWKSKNYRLLFYVLLVVGLIIHWLLIQSMGGLSFYLFNKNETLTAGGQGYLSIGLFLINFVYAISLTKFLYNGKEIILLIVSSILLLVLGIISGSKGQFSNPIIITLIVWHYLKRPINPILFVIGFILLVLIFPVFNIYRHQQDLNDLQGSLLSFYELLDLETLINQFMDRFHTFDSLVRIIKYTPDLLDYQYGNTIFPLFIVWIPRQLWEDKPTISFGKVFAKLFYSDIYPPELDVSASVGVIGEGYINFHIFGALVICFLFGIMLSALYQLFIKNNFGVVSISVYASIFMFVIIFWESNVAGFIAERGITLLVSMLIIFLVGYRKNYIYPKVIAS